MTISHRGGTPVQSTLSSLPPRSPRKSRAIRLVACTVVLSCLLSILQPSAIGVSAAPARKVRVQYVERNNGFYATSTKSPRGRILKRQTEDESQSIVGDEEISIPVLTAVRSPDFILIPVTDVPSPDTVPTPAPTLVRSPDVIPIPATLIPSPKITSTPAIKSPDIIPISVPTEVPSPNTIIIPVPTAVKNPDIQIPRSISTSGFPLTVSSPVGIPDAPTTVSSAEAETTAPSETPSPEEPGTKHLSPHNLDDLLTGGIRESPNYRTKQE